MYRNRAFPKELRSGPEADTEDGFELGQRDDVAVAAPREQRLHRRAVQAGVAAHAGEGVVGERRGEPADELLGGDDLERGAVDELAFGEGRGGVGEELDGTSLDTAALGHRGDATDAGGSDVRPNARSSTLGAGKNQHPGADQVASERDRLIGQRVHALIAAHLREGRVPTPREVWVATSRLFAAKPMPQNASCRQRAACATSA